MTEKNKFIVIIRPTFMQFCKDACRAASLNHLLFRIAGKSKDQPREKIQAGDILWYAKTEQITQEMADAWGVCKVRKEVNQLIGMGLIGRRSNPAWGADRTKHFSFGTEQCAKLLDYCKEQNICVVHLDLPPEVMHLIYSSHANDTSITCICAIHQMEAMNLSNANDTSITAITKDSPTEIDDKDDNEEEGTGASAPPAQFAYQIVGYEQFYYHDFCSAAQDRGCNDGLTMKIKPLSDVPIDAICDICYGKMHEPHQYPTAPTSLREEVAELRERTEAALTETGKRRAISLHDHIDVEATQRRIPAIRMERAIKAPLDVRGATDLSTARTDGAATSACLPPSGTGPRASEAKKKASVVHVGPPPMPADDAQWNTTTCKALFDAWRGVTLIGTYKNSQASTCAKGLVDRYSRAEVEAAKKLMDADKYYIERGGADICDVANNIHKYRKRARAVQELVQVTTATLTPGLEEYGQSDFDVYKGNGPEERRALALLADTVPESYWE